MNKKIVNSSKSKKEIFQSFEKKPKSFLLKIRLPHKEQEVLEVIDDISFK